MALMFGLIACCILPTSYSSNNLTCKEILSKTIVAVEEIKTLKFHLQCMERFNGELLTTESQVKLNRSPRKIYIYLKGPEILWIEGKNNGNTLVNPQGFPYINLSLDPLGNLMRDKQHHTIHQMGFSYFADVIDNSIKLLGEDFDEYFKCAGIISWNNNDCYYITAEYPDFKYIDYTVLKGETLVTIAQKLKVSDYMILELNEEKVNNYKDVKKNQIIKVPNVYGSKIILYIDKQNFIPRVIKVYDEKGLFESYEYHDLELNPEILDEEFSKNYKGYGF